MSPRTQRRSRLNKPQLIGGGIGLAAVGAVLAFLYKVLVIPSADYVPQAPTWVPPHVTAERPQLYISSLTLKDQPVMAVQRFEGPTSYFLGQVTMELPIDTAGKKGVQIDGVEGWLWTIESGEWTDRNSQDEPYRDILGGSSLYGLVYRDRANPFLAGPCLAIQWNKDGVHYIVIGQESPETEQNLLRMANSLRHTERFEKV